jgi:formylglycine-generating enzyme required for sulfatase activity
MEIIGKYRYPGVQPFRTTEQHIFFGRGDDKDKLYNLIALEKLVVLFGKSGYGKSSLLNAGIIPMLTDEKRRVQFTPIEIRLGTYIPETARPPLQTVLQRLDEKLADTEGGMFLATEADAETLWYRFKRKQTETVQRIVLIFDQFEEFFSYPQDWQEQFRWQLADLMFTNMPESLRDRFDALTDAQQFFLSDAMNIKVVFSIRADRMSLMDALKDALPTILHKRYELRALTPTQAREAITKPAGIISDDFFTPPFEYTEGGLNTLIHALTTTEAKDTTDTGIEAFQLQIVCEYIESLVRDGKVPDIDGNGLPDITEAQLPEMASLYENYYRRKLAELTPSVQTAAQRVLEDGLLAEDAATGEGRRMSVDSRALLGQFASFGLTEKLLVDLEKTYLIRREVNTVGGFSFEISHDTLVAPIQKAKAERKAIEEKERLERERIENERQMAETKAQAAKDRRSKQIAYGLSIAALIGLAIAVWQFFEARQANRNVEYLLMRDADKSILSLDYNVALEKCQTALSLGVAKDSTYQRLQEIAYFYTETDTFKAALNTLSLMNINADTNRSVLREAIKKISPSYFESLEHRYYPEMIHIKGGANHWRYAYDQNDKVKDSAFIKLNSFSMAVTETTVWQYFIFQRVTKHREPSTPTWQWKGNNPIVNISWYDAAFYLNWLSEKRGLQKGYELTNKSGDELYIGYDVVINNDKKGYRLPTEAEWEFAARGGTKSKGYEFSGANEIEEVAWYTTNSKSQTHPIRDKKANELGLFDMSGNVWEWCNDYWSDAYDISQKENPRGAEKGSRRVVRGGSWNYGLYFACAVSYRYDFSPNLHNDGIGFRCVRYD